MKMIPTPATSASAALKACLLLLPAILLSDVVVHAGFAQPQRHQAQAHHPQQPSPPKNVLFQIRQPTISSTWGRTTALSSSSSTATMMEPPASPSPPSTTFAFNVDEADGVAQRSLDKKFRVVQQRRAPTAEKTPVAQQQAPSTPTESSYEQIQQTQQAQQLALTKPIHTFASMLDCLDFLDDLEQQQPAQSDNNNNNVDDLYVIKYYASYCKQCQRALIPYKKLATTAARPAADGGAPRLHFTRVEAGSLSSDQLRDGLGVTKFPFVQIYRRSGSGSSSTAAGANEDSRPLACVASFSTGGAMPRFRKSVSETIDVCLQRSQQQSSSTSTSADDAVDDNNNSWDKFYRDFASHMDENQQARAKLRVELQAQLKHQGEGI